LFASSFVPHFRLKEQSSNDIIFENLNERIYIRPAEE
jgi:hypothetical protein